MSSAYVVDAQVSSRVPCAAHHSASPVPESGRVRSSTCSIEIRPDRQTVASTRPHDATLRSCSPGSRSTNAGCVTWRTEVRVPAAGSWTIPAPVMGSSNSRSRAMSPGSASVPTGRGVTTRRRYSNCPPVDFHIHQNATGIHSTIARPAIGTQVSTAASTQTGAVNAMSMPPPA